MQHKKFTWRVGLMFVVAATACGGTVSLGPSDSLSSGAGNGQATGGSHDSKGPPSAGGTAVASRGGSSDVPTDGGVSSSAAGAADSPGSAGTAGTSEVTSRKSTGCGLALPAQQLATIAGSRTGYTEWNVNATGATLVASEPELAGPRQFFVRVPANYDPSRPYRVVYLGQGCGAQHAGKTNSYPLFNEAQGGSEQAVYVGLSVPDNPVNPGCYDNNTGAQSQEWEAFELVHAFVESHYCVDNDQIYVAGYSTGAWLANMWGCYFGGTPSPPLDEPDVTAGRSQRKFSPHWAIRGALGTAGSLPPNQPVPCNGPAAHFWLHDAGDKSTLIETDIAALDLALKSNGCAGSYAAGPKRPWVPAEDIPGLGGGVCQEYTGCPAGVAERYPLVFCTTNGFGHQDQAERAIPAFTRFLEQIERTP